DARALAQGHLLAELPLAGAGADDLGLARIHQQLGADLAVGHELPAARHPRRDDRRINADHKPGYPRLERLRALARIFLATILRRLGQARRLQKTLVGLREPASLLLACREEAHRAHARV